MDGATRSTLVMLAAYLEPAHVEDELEERKDGQLKVADEAVVQLSTTYQAGQHEYVHRDRCYLRRSLSNSARYELLFQRQGGPKKADTRSIFAMTSANEHRF